MAGPITTRLAARRPVASGVVELTFTMQSPPALVFRAGQFVTLAVGKDPDGNAVRTDRLIPLHVVEAIKSREGIKFLEQANQISGEVRLGDDEAREGVTIWPEASPDDREFTLFFSGFSGETAKVPGPDSKDITLFKTLKLNYEVPGDAKFRDLNEVREVSRSYVMR